MSRAGAWVRVLCACAATASACSAEAVRPDARFDAFRADALARAKVFRTSATVAALAPQSAGEADLACRFVLTEVTGTTPKFDCELPDGTRVKIKYGRTPEIAGEVAATRLLTALGFGADRVTLTRTVRCYGCPPSPFYTRRLAQWTRLEGLLHRTRDYGSHRDFEWPAVERRLPGLPVETVDHQGWGFYELKQIDSTRGGADRADVDALRLMAVFLAHWDNKASNQRLVCLPPAERGGACTRPLVMLQDVGATFGPGKVDLAGWRRSTIWADARRCRVSLKHLPHDGGTFEDTHISDSGRRLLAERLGMLSTGDIRTLFAESRFPGEVGEWVAVFERKVREITNRACPPAV
jgi:hypothetical protein